MIPGGKMGRILLATIAALGLLRCAKSEHRSLYLEPAPTSLKQLGFIVSAQPEELDQLLKKAPDVKIRALSLKRNLFEVSSVSKEILQEILPAQELTPNVFMKEVSSPSRFATSNWIGKAQNTSTDAIAALKTCRRSGQAPKINANVSFDVTTLTIQLGESVSIQAVGQANSKVGGDVRYIWDMLPPQFSLQGFQNGIASEQSFTPDSTGLYLIGLIAQGADLSCNVREIYFMVTDNPELKKDQPMNLVAEMTQFKHIQEIKTDKAWNFAKGEGVTVAVIDSGVDYNHPGIQNNLKLNTADMLDGKDEDRNGFPDDQLGWDFANGDRFAYDDGGHGTHVAGLVASPLSGIAPESKILPVKVLDAGGRSDLATFVAGIYYAVDNGAQIINASLGFDTPKGASPFDAILMKPAPLVKALEYARDHHVLVMIAAGNGDAQTGLGFDIKERPVYPASINLENTVTVAATSVGEITSYSNFSKELVQIAAPGGDQKQFVLSLAKQNPMNAYFMEQAGTSMATPIASGVAALMLSANQRLLPQDIKAILTTTGDELASLSDKTLTGKLINAEQAVQAALDFKPAIHSASYHF
jgi:subtilisin family serine protease